MTVPSDRVERGFVVKGRVQGVGFRYWTCRQAERLGVVGTVANLSDGSVRVMARGSASALDELERVLGRGPALARVESVEPVPCDLPSEVRDFTVTR